MFSKKTDVERLHQKSTDIVDVFTKAVEGLTKVNEEVKTTVEKKQVEKEKLNEEIDALGTLKSRHDKVISKITSIFE